MGISRHATAHWEGDLKSGKGQLSTPQSGLLDKTRYGFNSRFGDEKGTNPAHLLVEVVGLEPPSRHQIGLQHAGRDTFKWITR